MFLMHSLLNISGKKITKITDITCLNLNVAYWKHPIHFMNRGITGIQFRKVFYPECTNFHIVTFEKIVIFISYKCHKWHTLCSKDILNNLPISTGIWIFALLRLNKLFFLIQNLSLNKDQVPLKMHSELIITRSILGKFVQ